MAAQVGQALKEARTERGIVLSEVERVTKIRVKFLRAMEEDRWDELPAPAYAHGFLQIYARYLDLDEEELLGRYRETFESEEGSEPVPQGVVRPGQLRRGGSTRPGKPIAIVVAGLVALVALGLVIAAALGGSSDGGKAKEHGGAKSAGTGTTTTTGTTATQPSRTSVELRATADVWVCLVDDRGRAFVDGETLTPDEVRGPFDAPAFDVTFGNGSVDLTVDGQPAKVPPVAEPLGYRITPSGTRPLDPSSQPTCQ
jgi:transcriptional regulator with XRE-family HTH domain